MSSETKHVFRVTIHGRIEDVWREITKTDEVQRAMFDLRLDSTLKPGSPMRMRSADGKYTGAVGDVLEFDPPRRYAHTFRFTNLDDPPCRVTYDLKQIEGGVDFTMTLDQLEPGTKMAKQMIGGSSLILKTLKSIIETGKVPMGTRMLYAMFRLMAPFTPKRCRTENWP